MNTLILEEPKVESKEAFFTEMYLDVFPLLARHIADRGGTIQESKDVFQDALIVFYNKMSNSSSFEIENKNGYVLGIAKKLWLKKYKSVSNARLRNKTFEQISKENEIKNGQKLLAHLEQAGLKCLNILKAFYYDKMPLKNIAETFDYSSERSATVQKYKCLEKVRNSIKENKLDYEDFID